MPSASKGYGCPRHLRVKYPKYHRFFSRLRRDPPSVYTIFNLFERFYSSFPHSVFETSHPQCHTVRNPCMVLNWFRIQHLFLAFFIRSLGITVAQTNDRIHNQVWSTGILVQMTESFPMLTAHEAKWKQIKPSLLSGEKHDIVVPVTVSDLSEVQE